MKCLPHTILSFFSLSSHRSTRRTSPSKTPFTAVIMAFSALCITLSACEKTTPTAPSTDKKVIAITQIIDHQTIDTEREAFLQGLKEAGFDDTNTKIIYENAQGNIATSTQIAGKFASLRPSLIVAFTTPSAQSAVAAASKTNIPVLFSTVTDPVGAKIVSKDAAPRTDNVTGISDYLPAKPQIAFIRRVMPSLKTLGVIYNPGEANAIVMVRELKEEAATQGIAIIEATASKTSDVATAAQSLVGKVDAIHIPNDNTAVASIASIVAVGEKNKLPVFAADMGLIDTGIVGAVGYERPQLGKRAADYAIRILKGEKAQDIPVAKDHLVTQQINPECARKMGLSIDSALKPMIKKEDQSNSVTIR